LIVALGDYIRLMREYGNMHGGRGWAWIEVLKKEIAKAQSGA
jgi:hypothetical protein